MQALSRILHLLQCLPEVPLLLHPCLPEVLLLPHQCLQKHLLFLLCLQEHHLLFLHHHGALLIRIPIAYLLLEMMYWHYQGHVHQLHQMNLKTPVTNLNLILAVPLRRDSLKISEKEIHHHRYLTVPWSVQNHLHHNLVHLHHHVLHHQHLSLP